MPDDFDTCKERTRQFVRDVNGARWLQLLGLKEPTPGCDPRWEDVPLERRIHYVAQVQGTIYDLAPCQFWPESKEILVQEASTYLARWDKVFDITAYVQ